MVSGNNTILSDTLPDAESGELEAPAETSAPEDGASFLSVVPDTDTPSVSGGNAASEAADQEDTRNEEDNILSGSDYTVTVSGSDFVGGDSVNIETLTDEMDIAQLETLQAILASEQRQELQMEACLSILLFLLIYGALKLIYRFFRLFF